MGSLRLAKLRIVEGPMEIVEYQQVGRSHQKALGEAFLSLKYEAFTQHRIWRETHG